MDAWTYPSTALANGSVWVMAALGRLWQVLHRGLWLLGATTLALTLLLVTQPQLRADLEQGVTQWLLQRQGNEPAASAENENNANNVAPMTDLRVLPAEQVRMTDWLARKYRVAAEPLAALVAEAHVLGRQLGLDPALLLAVMAQESRFNPLAASPWGAHGLMQVLTRVHEDKFEPHGGPQAAFDPLSNLRVGAQILHEAVRRAGSVPGGLRLYVGAVTLDAHDYTLRVLSERERLRRVAAGQRVAFNAVVSIPELVAPPANTPLEASSQPVAEAQQPS